MPVRILVADDHQVVRTGLRALLESKTGWQVCAEASNGREAVEKAGQLKPDVAVLDIGMPLLNGVEATRQIRKLSPHTEVLILTMHDSEVLVQEVLFFFKQKTAYEISVRDWSSDVCSSDLCWRLQSRPECRLRPRTFPRIC